MVFSGSSDWRAALSLDRGGDRIRHYFYHCQLCVRWFGPGFHRQQFQIGLQWVVLTLIFESTLGYFLCFFLLL